MSIEEKIQKYKELGQIIESLEQQKKELGSEILKEMPQKTLQTTDYLVRRYSRLMIKTSLEEARYFNAIKMTEIVDKEKIKYLHQLGQPVPGVAEIQYIQISALGPRG